MATDRGGQIVEDIINYKFRSRDEYLGLAITAAGVEKERWDGNRKLGQLGTTVIELVLTYIGYEADIPRSSNTEFKCTISSLKQRSAIAKRTGIDKCIRFNNKPGGDSPKVLAIAVSAIIAAVFLDCGKNMDIVLRVIERLSVSVQPSETVDPTMLSLPELSNLPDMSSVIGPLSVNGMIQAAPSVPPIQMQQFVESNLVVESSDTAYHFPTDYHQELSAPLGQSRVFESELEPDYPTEQHTQIEDCIGEPCREGLEGPRNVVQRRSTKRKARSAPRQPQERTQIGRMLDTENNVIKQYLLEESRKCQAIGHPPPQETFLRPEILEETENISQGNREVLSKILIYIASPPLIASLQESLESWRDRSKNAVPCQKYGFSKTERYQIITKLEKIINHSQLLRRHHIIELYRECGGSATFMNHATVMITAHDFRDNAKKAGNPKYIAHAEVTMRMVKEIFPDVHVGTEDYNAKYSNMKALHKLGQRLDILVREFGQGILGLILANGPTGQVDFGVSDKMIMKPRDTEFEALVKLLNKSQGALLRHFSARVSPIVDALTTGEPADYGQFGIEKARCCDILELPKGSDSLLCLIGGLNCET